MNFVCPVCKKEYAVSLEAARHVMGTGDKKHRDWLASEGENYGDLLVLQATNPGERELYGRRPTHRKGAEEVIRYTKNNYGPPALEPGVSVSSPITEYWAISRRFL